MKRFLKGCLMAVGVFLLLVVSCSIYVHHPHLSASQALAIDLRAHKQGNSAGAYQTTITNRDACEAILRQLRMARFVGFGAAPNGEMTIRYANGKADRVLLMWSPDHSDFLFFHHGFYKGPAERFFTELKDGGVDVTKL
jgi:hypothetical protein